MYRIIRRIDCIYLSTSSGNVKVIWSDLATFLRFCFSLIDLKYSLKLMATKSFTSSSAKNFKYHQSLEYTTLCI